MSPLGQLVGDARRFGEPLVVPGAYDALSARVIARLGFPAIYITGAGLSNSRLGVPDIGLVDLTQLVEHVSAIADIVEIPLIVDMDTGFGNAVSVSRTVRRLQRAGAAALQLEDQVSPKRCGHFAGKAVIPADEMVQKLHAAVDSRGSPELLIIARTDARATEGLAGAVERANIYRAAGADLIFVEAPESLDELAAIGSSIDAPLVANMVEGGITPLLERAHLGQLGFSVILYANSALRAALQSTTAVLSYLRDEGSTSGILDRMASWSERQNAVGKSQFDRLEEKYSG